MSNSGKQWLPGLVVALGLAALATMGLFTLRKRSSVAAARTTVAMAASNVDIDAGTSVDNAPAPNFQLTDQRGRETSLSQFRGKAVLIAFVDSQCTTICPLTTQSMVEALRILGPSTAAHVQLLGINANPLALKVSDVASYTRAHDMQRKWRFLTGSLPQLKKVWHDYSVYVSAINNDIDHQPVMVLIDADGRERRVYMTQMSYEGVVPQAQVLANDIVKLLARPPRAAEEEVSLRYVQPLRPVADVKLAAVGDRQQEVAIGAGHPHLILFFASWLDQNSNLLAELKGLDRYAEMAQRKDWPLPVAVDELATEPSSARAHDILARLARSGIRTPAVEDTDGRLGDGYQVKDLPWYSLSSPDGRIIWSHDGWLSAAALGQQIAAALAKNEPIERTPAPAAPGQSPSSNARPKTPAAE